MSLNISDPASVAFWQEYDRAIDIGASSIYSLLYVIGIPTFIYLRNREPIRSRGWLISVMQMTVALIDLIMRAVSEEITTCPVDTWRGLWLVPLWIYPYFGRVFVLWYNYNLQNVLLLGQGGTKKGRLILWIQSHPWASKVKFQVSVFIFNLILWSAVSWGVYYAQIDMLQPYCNVPSAFIINIIQAVLGVLLLLWSVVILWGVNDAYLLKYEFIYLLATGLPLFILWAMSDELVWEGFANNGFWVDLIEIVFFLGTIMFPIYGTRTFSRLLVARQRNLSSELETGLSSETGIASHAEEDMRIIIEDEVLLPSLQQFMIQSWAIENLLFIQKVDEYHKCVPTQRSALAKNILDEYIREGKLLFIIYFFFFFFFSSHISDTLPWSFAQGVCARSTLK